MDSALEEYKNVIDEALDFIIMKLEKKRIKHRTSINAHSDGRTWPPTDSTNLIGYSETCGTKSRNGCCPERRSCQHYITEALTEFNQWRSVLISSGFLTYSMQLATGEIGGCGLRLGFITHGDPNGWWNSVSSPSSRYLTWIGAS